MSSVVWRATAPILAAVVIGSTVTAGVLAQGATPAPVPARETRYPEPSPAQETMYPQPSPARETLYPQPSPARATPGGSPSRDERPSGPLDASDPARCQLWEEEQAPVVARPRFAAVGGYAVSADAVDVEQVEASCALSRISMERMPGVVRDLIEDLVPGGRLVYRSDARDDMRTMTGDPLTGEPDPALDVLGVTYGTLDVSRRQAQGLARALASDEFADEVTVTFSTRPQDWIERGSYQILILGLAGDPTTSPEADRIWQIGFQARDPAKSVAPLIPGTNPLAGVRNLLTYGQVARDDGAIQRSIGRSDFGSPRVGPDRQTQYYNARPDAAVIEWSDGLAFLFPEGYDPLGFRPMTFHRASRAWDLVPAPGGPMAFLPASGEAPGMFDFVGMALRHDPIDLPATLDGVASDSHLAFPSHNRWVFGSPIFDPTRPVLVDLGYSVEGHEVAFVDLVAQPLGDGLFGVSNGIPQYGRYDLTGLGLEQDGVQWPAGWDELAEMTRSLGTGAWRVGEDAGLLHGPEIHRVWLTETPEVVLDIDPDSWYQAP